MRLRLAARAAVLGAALATPFLAPAAGADARGGEVEAIIREYIALWNAHDAHAIWTRVYRLDAAQGMKSEADLAAGFSRLKADGYDHSDLQSVHACLLTSQVAMALLRFSRLKTDGSPMPPKDRLSIYMLRRFDDGWRVTGMTVADASARIDCASAEPAR
jgi:hypothetical protein